MKVSLGFTLIELLVVIAIISIITLSIGGNFSNSIFKGRDSKRKQDLEAVSRALELYRFDEKAYPTSIPGPGTPFVNASHTSVIYLGQVPQDPSSGGAYCYTTDSAGTYYKMYTNLENKNDPKIFTTPAAHLCNITPYNYGISSSNTSP